MVRPQLERIEIMNTVKEEDQLVGGSVEKPEKYRSFPADLLRCDNGYELVGELPGIGKESLKVSVDEDVLTIEAMGADYHSGLTVLRQEVARGNFLRQFRLSDAVDTQGIRARLENGVLLLDLPKKERFQARNIQIEG